MTAIAPAGTKATVTTGIDRRARGKAAGPRITGSRPLQRLAGAAGTTW